MLPPFPGGPPDGPPNIALNSPISNFIDSTDTMTVATTGGADVVAIPPLDMPGSKFDNIVVTTDLWGLTPAMLDGSQDLVINYTCNGGSCENASAVSIMMMVTDGGGPPPSDPDLMPYRFFPGAQVPPPATGTFNIISCLDAPNLAANSYTISKEFLGKMFGGTTWRQIFTSVSFPMQRISNTPDANGLLISNGHGVFGISRN
jgi:hypothetical protein